MSRCCQVLFLVRPFSLVCRWSLSLYVLVWLFLCAHTSLVSLCASKFPPLIRIPIRFLIGLPPPMASFNVITSLKTLSKYMHILRYRGLGLQHMDFCETQFSPQQHLESTCSGNMKEEDLDLAHRKLKLLGETDKQQIIIKCLFSLQPMSQDLICNLCKCIIKYTVSILTPAETQFNQL